MFTSDVNAAVPASSTAAPTRSSSTRRTGPCATCCWSELDERAEMLTGRHKSSPWSRACSTATSTASRSSATTRAPAPRACSPTPTSPTPSPASGSNGERASEGLLNAHVVAEYGVPVVLVTGDDRTPATTRASYAPEALTVAVKDYVSRYAAVCRTPARTAADIRAAAKEAAALACGTSPSRRAVHRRARVRRRAPGHGRHRGARRRADRGAARRVHQRPPCTRGSVLSRRSRRSSRPRRSSMAELTSALDAARRSRPKRPSGSPPTSSGSTPPTAAAATATSAPPPSTSPQRSRTPARPGAPGGGARPHQRRRPRRGHRPAPPTRCSSTATSTWCPPRRPSGACTRSPARSATGGVGPRRGRHEEHGRDGAGRRPRLGPRGAPAAARHRRRLHRRRGGQRRPTARGSLSASMPSSSRAAPRASASLARSPSTPAAASALPRRRGGAGHGLAQAHRARAGGARLEGQPGATPSCGSPAAVDPDRRARWPRAAHADRATAALVEIAAAATGRYRRSRPRATTSTRCSTGSAPRARWSRRPYATAPTRPCCPPATRSTSSPAPRPRTRRRAGAARRRATSSRTTLDELTGRDVDWEFPHRRRRWRPRWTRRRSRRCVTHCWRSTPSAHVVPFCMAAAPTPSSSRGSASAATASRRCSCRRDSTTTGTVPRRRRARPGVEALHFGVRVLDRFLSSVG